MSLQTPPRPIRFDVFGRRVVVERRDGGWVAFYPGNDGKRRPADFVIPPDVADEELGQYLADLFHEAWSPRHPEVLRSDD
ncbi:MAG: hypothetical protein EPO12_03570 [Aquabacterium sp.]|jgi:hypothetical protein|nr:MAG: hypothetical protein EPO12_03570 [Aquabacterium sp.]